MKLQVVLLGALVVGVPALARAEQDPQVEALEYSRLSAQYAAVQEARAAAGSVATFGDQRAASGTGETVQDKIAGATRQLAGFSIVLVQGEMTGSSATQGIPSGAAKALSDLKDFLPYRSYQLLDTQWAMSSGNVTTMLQRPGQAYRLHINAPMNPSTGEVDVRIFSLNEVDGQVIPGDLARLQAQLQVAREQLEQQMTRIDKGDRSGAAEAELLQARARFQRLEAQISEAQGSPRAMGEERMILSSSFRMKLGETVVVGTSRIAGDRALIVLLSAVAK